MNENLSKKENCVNLREHYIIEICRLLINEYRDEKFNFIETGCMFKEDEGRSTYHIARLIKANSLNAHFISVDNDPEHIKSCKALLQKYDKDLLDIVDFRCGDSRKILPTIANEMNEVHFFLLDSSGAPELCLCEFEIIVRILAKKGVILVDDIVELAPTERYKIQRPLGKGTFIYTFLLLAEFLRYRLLIKNETRIENIKFDSMLINSFDKRLFLDLLGNNAFKILSNRMLAYGNPDVIDQITTFKSIGAGNA